MGGCKGKRKSLTLSFRKNFPVFPGIFPNFRREPPSRPGNSQSLLKFSDRRSQGGWDSCSKESTNRVWGQCRSRIVQVFRPAAPCPVPQTLCLQARSDPGEHLLNLCWPKVRPWEHDQSQESSHGLLKCSEKMIFRPQYSLRCPPPQSSTS